VDGVDAVFVVDAGDAGSRAGSQPQAAVSTATISILRAARRMPATVTMAS